MNDSLIVMRDRPPIGPPKSPTPPNFVPNGWLWIMQAIEQTGRKLYCDEWTGNEFAARILRPLVGIEILDRERLIEGGRVSFATRTGGRSVGAIHIMPRSSYEIVPSTPDDYAAERASADRFAQTVEWLRQRFWAGELTAYTLKRNMIPVPSGEWGDNNFFVMATRYGFHSTVGAGHLFIRKDDLDAALADARPRHSPGPSKHTLISDVTRFKRWFTEEVTGGPKKHKKDYYLAHGRQEFGISRNQAAQVYGDVIKEAGAEKEWSCPGPRPRSKRPDSNT